MGISLLDLAGGAANLAHALRPATSAESGMFAPASLPDWLQLLGLIVGIVAAAAIFRVAHALGRVEARLPAPESGNPKAFTEMLCTQIWQHSDKLRDLLAQRLRMPPADIAALRILVRLLREDLAAPLGFVEQVQAHPPARWPSPALFNAFSSWAGQVRAMATQLSDLNQQLTFPLIREPVDKGRDATLVYQFHTERAFLDRGVDALRDLAFDFCDAAAKVLEAERKKARKHADRPFWNTQKDEQEEEAHPHCPCCRRAPEQHGASRRDPMAPVVLPPPPAPPPPPPSPAPAPAVCCCAAPRACQCSHGCACACICRHTKS